MPSFWATCPPSLNTCQLTRELSSRPRPRPLPPPRALEQSSTSSGAVREGVEPRLCRVFTVSDLHADYPANWAWVTHLAAAAEYRRDVLVLAGDACDDLAQLEAVLAAAVSAFGAVFYTPGNHELWVRKADRAAGLGDSLAKLRHVVALCADLGVHTAPTRIGAGLWVAPLWSWHHASFDAEPDVPGVPPASHWTVADYAACAWPPHLPGGGVAGSLALAEWFDSLNDGPAWEALLAERPRCDVVAFSHFLPLQALLPEKRYLYYPNLHKAVGSLPLAERVAALRPDIHVFGHTHFAWDSVIGGVRYIQAPLCAPSERERRLRTVAFEASMGLARADPLAARWLPQLLYQAVLQNSDDEEEAALPSSGRSQGLELLQRMAGAGGTPPEAGGRGGSAAGGARPPAPTAGSGGREDGEPFFWLSTPSDPEDGGEVPPPLAPPRSRPLPMLGAGEGMIPLRHGVMPPDLGAHWSLHYAATPRTPGDTALAPWVRSAALYERRVMRASARAAAAASRDSQSREESPG